MTKLDTMKQEKKAFQISNDIAWEVRDFLIMKINQADPSNNSLEDLMKLDASVLVTRYFLRFFQTQFYIQLVAIELPFPLHSNPKTRYLACFESQKYAN